MRLFLVVPWLSGRLPSFDMRDPILPHQEMAIFLQSNDYYQTSSGALSLDMTVVGMAPSLKEMRKSIYLISSPDAETLEEHEFTKKLYIKLSKMDGKDYQITSKKPLEEEQTYGLYLKNIATKKFELIHSFFVLPKPPQMVAHNLTEDEQEKRVEIGQIFFSFIFDQPIFLHNDQAITLISIEEGAPPPEIERITVAAHGKDVTVQLRLGANFQLGTRYAFIFNDGIKNRFGQAAAQEPMVFLATKPKKRMDGIEALTLRTSHDAVEFNWHLIKDIVQ